MGRGISPKAVLNTAVLQEYRGFSEKTSVLRTAAFEAEVWTTAFESRGLATGALFQTTAVFNDRGF